MHSSWSSQSGINSRKVIILTTWVLAFSALALLSVISVYLLRFSGFFSGDQETWGLFGDYLGGVLNPMFSFLSLIVLVLTLALQSRQLELTHIEVEYSREELAATREELKRTSAAQELSAKALSDRTSYAALSARLSALSAGLSVVSELLRQYQQTQALNAEQQQNLHDLQKRKDKIEDEILAITEDLYRE